jgi:hypothetical protein
MTESLSIQIAKTVEEVEAMRPAWTAMQSNPDGDIDFFLTLLKTNREILRPHVITLWDNDGIRSILVGRIERKHLTVGFGYAKMPLPSARCLTIIGSGLFGDRSDRAVSALFDSVEKSLKDREVDVVWFHQIEGSSNVDARVRHAMRWLRRDHFPSSIAHWKGRLAPTYEQFLRKRSSATRNDLKRSARRLEKVVGDQISFKQFREPEEVDQLATDVEIVASKSYHRSLNAGFIDNQETRQRMSLYAKEGRLRVHILYVSEKPIAYWIGFIYQKTFYTWTTGYDPIYRQSAPGLFLLQRVLQDLCEEHIAEAVDFGSGYAQYKRDLGDEDRPDVSLYWFGPSFRGIVVNLMRTPLLAMVSVARRSLEKGNLLQTVKQAWRKHLSKTTGQ